MQPERNQKLNMPWDDQVRSRGNKAGFAFQDRDCKDSKDLTHDWEWYSKGEAASLTYGGPNGAEKLKFDAPKGSLTIDGNVGIGTTPSAKLHVAGDLQVDKGATITGLLSANNGLTVNGGALTVGDVLKAQKGTIISGAKLDAQAGASITGDLTVTGKATVTDLLTASKGLTVNGGALTLGDVLKAQKGATISGAKLDAQAGASITGDLTVTGKSTITDLLTASKGLTVNGGALTLGDVLKAQKGATISGAKLDAQAGASITGDLTVTGKATITDLLTASKGLTVNGGALTVNAVNPLNAQGGATISGAPLNALNGASITGDLKVTGKTDVTNLLTVKNLVVDGNVGIGTMDPKARMHVAGTLIIDPKGKGGILIGNPNTGSEGFTSLAINISEEKEGHSELQSIKTAGSEWGDLCLNPLAGNVGIGTTSPEVKLHVVGDIKIAGKIDVGAGYTLYGWPDHSVSTNKFQVDYLGKHAAWLHGNSGEWTRESSRLLKTNIATITDVLEKLDQIQGVYFNWIDTNVTTPPDAPKERYIGMIAEEVQAVFPELVSTNNYEDKEILGLAYSSFTSVLVQAVKELKALNQSLSERVKALEASAIH